jgi:hypothetical protein
MAQWYRQMRWPHFTDDQKVKIGQLWVTSVGGIALVIVIQAFGQDWSHWWGWSTVGWSGICWKFTFDRWIRYGLALWFEFYMVLAFLANDVRGHRKPSPGLIFDVLQSVLTFVSLGMLGFITQDFDGVRPERALKMAFFTVGFIGFWTFITHSTHSKKGERASKKRLFWQEFGDSLQQVRFSALVIAVVAIGYLWRRGYKSLPDLGAVLVLVLASLGVLYWYAVCAFLPGGRKADGAAEKADLDGAATSLIDAGKKLQEAGHSLQSIKLG